MGNQLVDDLPAKAPSGRLGRYEIVKCLAIGEMSDLLLARLSSGGSERHLVIKQVHEAPAKDATFLETFVTQARLARGLHHDNIVQVEDVGEHGGKPYVAMEYVHGEDLRKMLARLHRRNQTIPVQHLVTIGTSVAAALHHAHDHLGADRKPLGLVHHDVTPTNILVGYDGNVKISDFGIARAAIRTLETRVGGLKGKVPYLAPEQCTGQGVDRRSDIFALGIVLYELATSRRLFKGASDFLTMATIVSGTVPRPSQYHKALPDELERIILKALSRSPADRYQTAAELRAALDGFAAKAKLAGSAAALAVYMTQLFGERREPWLEATAITAVTAVSVAPSVDFDGSTAGLAQAPAEAVEMFAIPDAATSDSPIAHAHAHAVNDNPTVIVNIPKKPVALGSFGKMPRPELNDKTPRPRLDDKTPRPELDDKTPRPGLDDKTPRPEAKPRPSKPELSGRPLTPEATGRSAALPSIAKSGAAPPRAAGNRLPSPTQPPPRAIPVTGAAVVVPAAVAPRAVAPRAVAPRAIAPPAAAAAAVAPPAVAATTVEPPVAASRPSRNWLPTEVDETITVVGETTRIAAPPPPPAIITGSAPRRDGHDSTQVVAPLPLPTEPPKRSPTAPALREVGTASSETMGIARQRRRLAAGLIGGGAIIAVILLVVIGFSSDAVTSTPPPEGPDRAAAKPAQPSPPAPEPPGPERTMRTSEPPPTTDVTANAPAEPPPEPPRPERTMRTSEPPPTTDVTANAPAEPPRPERTMRNSEPPPTTDVTANAPAEPPPAKVQAPPASAVPPAPSEPTPPPRPPKRPSVPAVTHKPTQVAKPVAKPPTKPSKPAYDPDSLFLKKP